MTSVSIVTRVREEQKAEQRLYNSSTGRGWRNCFSQASNCVTSVTSRTSVTGVTSATSVSSVTIVTSQDARQGQKVDTEKKRMTRTNMTMMFPHHQGFFFVGG